MESAPSGAAKVGGGRRLQRQSFTLGLLATGVVTAWAISGKPAVAFVDVTVVPMDHDRIVPGQTVVVQGSRITAIGPAGHVRVPAGARRIDGRGKYLIPGLADMHFHLGPGGPENAERQLFLLLANGVTTIRNVDYALNNGRWLNRLDRDEIFRLRARARVGELLSPRIYTSGPWRVDSTQSVEQNLTTYRAAGYDFLKIHDESRATLDTVLPIARRLGLRVVGHVVSGEPEELTRALASPYSSIEHLRGYQDQDPATRASWAAATRRAGVWNCPTMLLLEGNASAAPQRLSLLPGARYAPLAIVRPWRRATTKSDTVPAAVVRARLWVRALQDAGAGLLLGTDGLAVGYPGFAVHQELEALVRAGLTPYEALATGTRNVASFLGTSDSSGTVAIGKRADLVLLYGNPLSNIRHTAVPAGVMVGGRWLSRDDLDTRLADYVVADP